VLPLFDQIYLVAGAVGFLFITVGFVMGQMHGGHSHAEMGHDGGDHGTLDHDSGGDFSGADDSSGEHHGDSEAEMIARGARTIVENPAVSRQNLMLTFLKIISPTNIAILLFCFGFCGIMVSRSMPFLGWLSMIPAILGGFFFSRMISRTLSYVVRKMHSSTNHRIESLIGRIGEATCSIPAGKMGEITYQVGSIRHTAPAKSKAGDIAKMTKVIIADVEDGICYVEPSKYDI